MTTISPIHPGTQERVISETTSAGGSTSVQGSIQTDALVASLWVGNVTSGTLDINIYTLTDEGKEVLLFSFPQVSSATSTLLLRKSGVSMSRFRVEAIYTGVCSYEVYIRAIEQAGESSVTLLGSTEWTTSKVLVGTSAVVLIPAALDDRQGVLVKNWSTTADVYIAESLAKATAADGYPLAPRDAIALDIASGASVYAVSSSAGTDIRIVQAGGS